MSQVKEISIKGYFGKNIYKTNNLLIFKKIHFHFEN